MPWFILFFVVAALIRSSIPEPAFAWDFLVHLARIGLTITLFLIGASLSRRSIAAVGLRPLLLGVVLWVAVSAAGLWGVLAALA